MEYLGTLRPTDPRGLAGQGTPARPPPPCRHPHPHAPDRSTISAARHRFLAHIADHAHLPKPLTLAETAERWWDGIETYPTTGISNAAPEGDNHLIELGARNAFGPRNRENQRPRSRCATTRQSRREAHPH
ncbi:transposase [Streptomyces sp. I6]|uniref:transposase n=1 Tax=Streptomyces sp. I6 TaxID=2483113 RepID=UPI001609C88A|nr:transposase [Streptomyces sp. I6]